MLSDNISIAPNFNPIIIKLKKNTSNILNLDPNIKTSAHIDYAEFKYGFHFFLHSEEKNISIELSKFNGKKKVYRVMSEFEVDIDDSEISIANGTRKKLKLQDVSYPRGFYKGYETFQYWNILDAKGPQTIVCIANGTYGWMAAAIEHRKSIGSKDNMYVYDTWNNNIKGNKVLLDTYSQIKVISSDKQLESLGRNKVNVVIGDFGMAYQDNNLQEQLMLPHLLEELELIIRLQAKGGSCILKFYETFTNTSLKMIALLTELYDNVYVTKPLVSRRYNTEKYITCIGFKLDKVPTALSNIYKNVSDNLGTLNIIDIFPGFTFSHDFLTSIKVANTTLANEFMKSLGRVVTYINNANFHGDAYFDGRNVQLHATAFWLNTFIDGNKTIHDKIVKTAIDKSNADYEVLKQKLKLQ